jgi:plasmid stabilization system protein ParE
VTDLQLHFLAEVEMNEAARFYELRVPGLGQDFLTEIERCFAQVTSHPESGQAVFQRFRRVLTRRFPFAVIYELLPDDILVVAIAHQHRRPGYWRGRTP